MRLNLFACRMLTYNVCSINNYSKLNIATNVGFEEHLYLFHAFQGISGKPQ